MDYLRHLQTKLYMFFIDPFAKVEYDRETGMSMITIFRND
jgi:hypothetical protein